MNLWKVPPCTIVSSQETYTENNLPFEAVAATL